MGVTVTDTDRGFRALKQRLETSFAPLDVGVDEKPHEGSPGMSVADIATIHEFGLGVPERSFLRSWADEHAAEIREYIADLATQHVIGNITRAEMYERLGRWAVQGVQQKILSNVPPPLAAETAKRKGSDLALVATGQLLEAIVWEIMAYEKIGTLDICGTKVEVRTGTNADTDGLDGAYGCFDTTELVIWLHSALPKRKVPDTLTHEALHAIWLNSGARFAIASSLGIPDGDSRLEALEETLVRILTPHVKSTFGLPKVCKRDEQRSRQGRPAQGLPVDPRPGGGRARVGARPGRLRLAREGHAHRDAHVLPRRRRAPARAQ